MKRFTLAVIAAALFAPAFSAPAHSEIIARFESGRWQVGVVTRKETGKFRACVAVARDPNVGVTLMEVDDGGKWRLGLGNDGWKLKVGATVPVRYRFDESRWWHATAVAVKSRLYIIPLDADREAVDGFRHGRQMQIHYGERSLSMDLTGSSQLLFDLTDCVKRYRDGT